MNLTTNSILLPGASPFPGELYISDESVNMMIQGSMWTLTPDVNLNGYVDYSVRLSKITASVLTPQQKKVLRLIGIGLLDKEIADKCKISIHTVRHHKDHICSKYGVMKRKAALSVLASRLNLV